MNKITITITGRRGAGKTWVALIIKRALHMAGVKQVEIRDDDTADRHLVARTLDLDNGFEPFSSDYNPAVQINQVNVARCRAGIPASPSEEQSA